MIPEESTNEELLGLEQECVAEKETRENCRKIKRNPKRIYNEGFSKKIYRLNKLLKNF